MFKLILSVLCLIFCYLTRTLLHIACQCIKCTYEHSMCWVHSSAYIEAISAEFTQEPSIILLELLHTKTKRYLTLNSTFKVIPYSAKLSRENTFMNWQIFSEKTFMNCSLVPPTDTTPPNFKKKKLLRIATKPQNSQKFSDLKVLRYMTHSSHTHLLYNTFKSYIEAMILDEFTQEPSITSRSYNCIHVQYIKSTSKGLYN